MSRTYRRKKETVRIEKTCLCPWSVNQGIWALSGYGYDKQNSLYIGLETQDEAEDPWVKRKVAKHFSDSGTRKDFRSFKRILKRKYRMQCSERMHHGMLRDEDIQLSTFKVFDTGIWWD